MEAAVSFRLALDPRHRRVLSSTATSADVLTVPPGLSSHDLARLHGGHTPDSSTLRPLSWRSFEGATLLTPPVILGTATCSQISLLQTEQMILDVPSTLGDLRYHTSDIWQVHP